jgi:hypothetical protein
MAEDTRKTFEVEIEHDGGRRTILVLADDSEEARSGARYWKKGYERIGAARQVNDEEVE